MYYLADNETNGIIALRNPKLKRMDCFLFPDLDIYDLWVAEGKAKHSDVWKHFADTHAEKMIGKLGAEAIEAIKRGKLQALVVYGLREDGTTTFFEATLQEMADA